MSGTIPPIPPPFSASSGNPSSPNVNRVDTMPVTTDPINTTNITNVSQSVVDENLPQLLDLRGGSHVINVPAFDKEDFTTHEGPSDTRDTKIAALRVKFNAFKSLEGEKVMETLKRNPATNSRVDLNAESHERAQLKNQKRFYKRSGRVGLARKPLDKTKESCFACGKLGHFQKTLSKKGKKEKENSEKGLIAESFDWDDKSVSSDDEGSTKIKAFMVITEDEPLVGKADTRSGQWVDITMKNDYLKRYSKESGPKVVFGDDSSRGHIMIEHEHVVMNSTPAGMRHHHLHLYIQRISLTGFPAQSVGSSNTDVLDLPCLLVLITGTSQSRQHVDTSLIHIESRKSPTAVLFDDDTRRISIRHCEY
ncbi:hypothetical protein Tco_1133951 [Tanacetum coccineum]